MACREVLRAGPSAVQPPRAEEATFLTLLSDALPVDQEPGHWRLYELSAMFPMAVGLTTGLQRGKVRGRRPGESCPGGISSGNLGNRGADRRGPVDAVHVSVGHCPCERKHRPD